MADRVFATYWIETAFPLAQAAETMAGEQSTGTFVRVPGETDALREAHSARVESIEELEDAAAPRSEEHTSELQSLMRISYAVFCLKKKKNEHNNRLYFQIASHE